MLHIFVVINFNLIYKHYTRFGDFFFADNSSMTSSTKSFNIGFMDVPVKKGHNNILIKILAFRLILNYLANHCSIKLQFFLKKHMSNENRNVSLDVLTRERHGLLITN